MLNICIIDDDYSISALRELLDVNGCKTTLFDCADDFLAESDQWPKYDVFIIDLMMQPASSATAPNSSGNRTGLRILAELRKSEVDRPVILHTAAPPHSVPPITDSRTTYVFKGQKSPEDFLKHLSDVTGVDALKQKPAAFIVHGHDTEEKLSLKNYLQNRLGFSEPIILHEQPSYGRTIIEKFEGYAANATFVFVLLTPDDVFCKSSDGGAEKYRSRQNVIFEAGYFLGKLGRASGRVMLLHKDGVDLPSDLAGLIYIDISNGVESAGEEIRRELGESV